jgi:DNA-binding beta-propeller fold protein YncE
LTGTSITAAISISVVERFGHFVGRPFGIGYLAGSSPEILVTELDANTLTLVNATTYAILGRAAAAMTPTDIALNSAATQAYVTAVNGPTIAVVNVPSGTKQQDIAEPAAARLLLSPDGTLLYVGRTGGVDVLSMATGLVVRSLAAPGQMNGIALSSDGTILWASNPFTSKVYRINTATLTITDSVTTGGAPQEILYHSASGNLYVANESGWVDVLQGSHLTSVARFGGIAGAFGMRLTPDGSKLLVASSQIGTVYELDRANGSVLNTTLVGGTPRRIVFLPDGRAAIANEAGWVSLLTP